jgi:DNA helicase IV
LWTDGVGNSVDARNERFLRSELRTCREFFEKVERSPLTEEQARAVICFDNRVQVIASAGSGKTSTMVAKAGYALHRGLVPADKILLLAFNKDAAEELKERIRTRLHPLGLPAAGISAQTFHSFGLDVIGRATGRKPALAPWLTDGTEHDRLLEIINDLRGSDRGFRRRWDFFRIVLGQDLPEFGQEETDPEDWDPGNRTTGFRTLQGEVVKSQAERTIADWLFYNGVRYVYEPEYEHPTADATHRQYSPDFYYPDINAYHEHFALDQHGNPPAAFQGYLEGVHWKRALHQHHGTILLETTMAGVWDGTAFDYLEREMEFRGLKLAPDPNRPVPGRRPIENEQLVRTLRTFLIHAKSNQLSDHDLRDRLRAQPGWRFRFRHTVFLSLFAPIRRKWDEALSAGNYIDFEDMLNQAADHLESGRWDSGYDLVMVDEMQDASHARARLAKALVNRPGRYLFAVGDDWQSINRFAGADLSVMTDFSRWFGEGTTLRLERTFRSPQSLCDISSTFIRKNPQQLSKRVSSTRAEFPPTLQAVSVPHPSGLTAVIERHLDHLNRGLSTGDFHRSADGKAQVMILGRYRHEEQYVPAGNGSLKRPNHLSVGFNTIHGSKGLEADYVIILGLTKGSYGFPSTIIDDPVLQIAMPKGDTFPQAEERRLFYVALTRAKRSVLLLTVDNKASPFLTELIREHGLAIQNKDGNPAKTTLCTACGTGFMVQRKGPYGTFYGCSHFPKCRNTTKSIP